jgi:hypothetical protein
MSLTDASARLAIVAAGAPTPVFNSINDIPTVELQSLKNTDQAVQYLLAKSGLKPLSPAAPPLPRPNPDRSG